MLMTEKQASSRWCPRMPRRAPEHLGLQAPQRSVRADSCSCIGSSCMAWRWKMELTEESRGQLQHVMRPTGERWSCKHCEGSGAIAGECCPECEGVGQGNNVERVGYCGLAGGVEQEQ